MQGYSGQATESRKVTLTDKIIAVVAILSLAGSIAVSYSTNQSKLSNHEQAIAALWSKVDTLGNARERLIRLEEKVTSLKSTNEQTLDVLTRLAESVDKLSVSVGRLDERTKYLEENRGES